MGAERLNAGCTKHGKKQITGENICKQNGPREQSDQGLFCSLSSANCSLIARLELGDTAL